MAAPPPRTRSRALWGAWAAAAAALRPTLGGHRAACFCRASRVGCRGTRAGCQPSLPCPAGDGARCHDGSSVEGGMRTLRSRQCVRGWQQRQAPSNFGAVTDSSTCPYGTPPAAPRIGPSPCRDLAPHHDDCDEEDSARVHDGRGSGRRRGAGAAGGAAQQQQERCRWPQEGQRSVCRRGGRGRRRAARLPASAASAAQRRSHRFREASGGASGGAGFGSFGANLRRGGPRSRQVAAIRGEGDAH